MTNKMKADTQIVLSRANDYAEASQTKVHIYGTDRVCDTDSRGYENPGNKSPAELIVDATSGFIPLWNRGTILRWRFQERSIAVLENPLEKMANIRQLLGEALIAWGDVAPIRFTESSDNWDFEIAVREGDRCNINGCVLASAFFPDAGQHELVIYPKLFEQDRSEQVETLIHEIGHIFGLRHFFAKIREEQWPSEIFGTHNRFTIMNYGADSILTENDRADLKALYQQAWTGQITQINGTPIRLVRSFSDSFA
jgi:Matrixin